MKTLWFASALLQQGWEAGVRIGIDAGRIARVDVSIAPQPDDERHGIALPGMANLHSHAFQRAMAGLAELAGPGGDNFWTWREAMYRFLDAIGPEELEAISAYAFMEMLESGFTRVGEFHYVHHDPQGRPYSDPGELSARIAAAARAAGIGLSLLPVMYAHGNFGGLAPTHGQHRFVNGIEQFARLVERAREAVRPLAGANLGIAPHSLRAVTPAQLQAVVALAPNGPIHIHAAEQVKEVEDCLHWCGQRPVEWLLDHAAIDERWCLVHATHMNDVETRRLARSGAVAGLCPVTEANLGDGVFPTPEYLEAGGRFGVGSDSNVLISPVQELRMLEYAQRLTRRSRNVLACPTQRSTGRSLFEASLRGGAQALRAGPPYLLPGAAANIVSLDADHPTLAQRSGDAILDSWIFAGAAALVDTVWCHGRRVVSRGRHVNRDAIESRYRDAVRAALRR